jgi:hypothetical protein
LAFSRLRYSLPLSDIEQASSTPARLGEFAACAGLPELVDTVSKVTPIGWKPSNGECVAAPALTCSNAGSCWKRC